MTEQKLARALCLTTLGLLIGAAIANAQGTAPSAAQTAQAEQSKTEAPARNKAIVELEKQIAGQESKPAEEVFKNIKIFKGQPAIRVLRVMEIGFGPSLGMSCTGCHVKDQWDKEDKKEKEIARKMWAMMMNLNKEVKEIADEKAAVNCYTCHRGQKKPALSPQSTGATGASPQQK